MSLRRPRWAAPATWKSPASFTAPASLRLAGGPAFAAPRPPAAGGSRGGAAPEPALRPPDHHLEVVAGHDERALAAVELREQPQHLRAKRLLALRVQRGERFVRGPVVAPELIDPVLGRKVAEGELLPRR